MVGTRMEARVENIERMVSVVQRDVARLTENTNAMREMLMEMQAWMRRKDTEEERRREQAVPTGVLSSSGTKNQPVQNTEETGNNGGVGNQRTEMGGRKLKLPIFKGEDPYGWIFRAERYFGLNRISDSGRVAAAAVCMEGEAVNWFRCMETRIPMQSWAALKVALLQRFSRSHERSPYESLMAIQQTGTIAEYRRRFEAISALLADAREEILKAAFVNGLRAEIRAVLKLFQPNSLIQVIELAQRIEERNQALEEAQMGINRQLKKIGSESEFGPTEGGHGYGTSCRDSSLTVYSTDRNLLPGRDLPYRRMTEAEIQGKGEKGICFRCDAKFHPGHRCGGKQFQVLLIEENEGGELNDAR